MLCAVCVWMFQGSSGEGNHHDTYYDLVKAADLGCKICTYLQKLRDEFGADEAGEALRPFTTYTFKAWDLGTPFADHSISIRSKASWLIDYSNYSVKLHISKPSPTPRWWWGFVRDIKQDLEATPWNVREDAFGTQNIPKSTEDPEVSRLGLEWTESCQTHHSRCRIVERNRVKDYSLPRRLLDVGTLHSNEVRLVTNSLETLRLGEKYATLSHCWGKDPSFLRLTTENLPQLSTTIALQSLPQSFRDAIVSCRRLGIQYLWIDSLCILQSGPGAEEDWQRHVNEMHAIYANCSLNISIAHASNPEHGAFVERNTSFLQTTFVCMSTRKRFLSHSLDRSHGFVTDVEGIGSEDDTELGSNADDILDETETCLVTIFAAKYDFQSFVQGQALWKRGWVFQERLMAPRMLVFGSDRIYWRCYELHTNEYLPHGLPRSGEMFDPRVVEPFSLPDVTHLDELSIEELSDFYRTWYTLVDWYSGTNLTYSEKDKLTAMAAIARHFDRLLPGRYCAGIFEADLHYGLLWQSWYRHIGEVSLKRLDWWFTFTLDPDRSHKYQAPTWSWASVNDRTVCWYSRGTRQLLADIEGVSIDLKDAQNPYGQVVSAELIISGTLISLDEILESWILVSPRSSGENCKPELSDEKLFALFIGEMVPQEHEGKSTGKSRSHLGGIILTCVRSNVYQRRGVFRANGLSDSKPFSNEKSKHVTVVIV